MAILDGDRDALGRYVRDMADLMGLRDWTVGIASDPPEDDEANASVEVTFGRRYAMIKFSATWTERAPEEMRQTVVHELAHCHLWSMNQRICDLHNLLGTGTYEVMEKAYRENLELAIDAIAQAWAETLPLPVKADESEAA